MCCRPAADHDVSLGSKWSVLLLGRVMQEASEVLHSPFFTEVKVSVDAIKIHLWGKNRVLPEVTMKVFEKLKETDKRRVGAFIE